MRSACGRNSRTVRAASGCEPNSRMGLRGPTLSAGGPNSPTGERMRTEQPNGPTGPNGERMRPEQQPSGPTGPNGERMRTEQPGGVTGPNGPAGPNANPENGTPPRHKPKTQQQNPPQNP